MSRCTGIGDHVEVNNGQAKLLLIIAEFLQDVLVCRYESRERVGFRVCDGR
jgi:hypothetical protein